MYFTKVMLLVFLGIFSLHDVRAQNGLMIGNYIISGQAKFAKDGINLNINAKQIQPGGVVPDQPLGPTNRPISLAEGGMPSAGPDAGGESGAISKGANAHNAYRETHMAQPLESSSELNKKAQDYASYLSKNGLFEHDGNRGDEGENLGLVCGGSGDDEEVMKKIVKAWYMEVCKYDFDKPGFDGNTGHFTQVVWKGSKQLGLGLAKGSYGGMDDCSFVVGRYKEPGNMMGSFPDNVQKGSFNKEETCKDYEDYKPYAGKRNKLIKNSLIKLITTRKTGANRNLQLIL